MLARCSSSTVLAARLASQSCSSAVTSFSSPAKASSRRRWVEASTRARSSCWPWISTSAEPTALRVCTLIAWSLMKARVRPSANCTRRRIISQESSELASSRPLSLRMAEAGCPLGTSNTAVTCPCSTPCRTRPASPRPPSASAKASSRMDLPAPVSPVSTASPRENSISSRSIRTMSRIDRRASMRVKILTETEFLEGPGDVGAGILLRLDAAGLHEIISIFVPRAVRKIVPEHGGRGLRLADDADRHIGLGEPGQRLLDMPRGLIPGHHGLETVDRTGVVQPLEFIAADLHFLARELVARVFELGLGVDGVFGGRIFADHFVQCGDGLFGPALIAADVRNLVVMRRRDQILRVGRIRASGMQGDVTGRSTDAAVEVAGIVEGIGRHQQRFARPVGIGVLTVDFLEFLRRRLRVVPFVHQVQALIVELVGRFIDEGVVLGEKLVPDRAGAAPAERDREHDQARGQPKLPAEAAKASASRYPA